jgi:hypothetical protein
MESTTSERGVGQTNCRASTGQSCRDNVALSLGANGARQFPLGRRAEPPTEEEDAKNPRTNCTPIANHRPNATELTGTNGYNDVSGTNARNDIDIMAANKRRQEVEETDESLIEKMENNQGAQPETCAPEWDREVRNRPG